MKHIAIIEMYSSILKGTYDLAYGPFDNFADAMAFVENIRKNDGDYVAVRYHNLLIPPPETKEFSVCTS